MYIPFFSRVDPRRLHRRKGGGGGGRGGGGGGRSSSGSKGSSSSSSKPTINFSGTSKTATVGGQGGGKSTVIPAGFPFAGRAAGGGTRPEVLGDRYYGSGYPGVAERGVAGRGFPFYFWPIAWAAMIANSAESNQYLYATEYGSLGNTDRPGGSMVNAAFQSNDTGSIYRVVTDNATALALIPVITTNCSGSIGDSDLFPVSNSSDSSQAQPEQAIQYYRASSVVLTLDGYNNSAAVFGPEGTADSQLPAGIDENLLDCINKTIQASVPLVDSVQRTIPKFSSLGLTMAGLILLMYSA